MVTPLYNEGMRGLCICTAGFSPEQKKYIKERVEYMGGIYDGALRSATTHLIALNNINHKVMKAYNRNIPIMKIEWIDEVWARSKESNVNGRDEEFKKFMSPLFHNLKFTTSGMSKKEKEKIKELIELNGGVCAGAMEQGKTNFVILSKPEGEKFKHARQWKIPCVNPKWIFNCVNLKAVIPFEEYIIQDKPKSSTPEKDVSNITANFSMISNITHVGDRLVTHLEETLSSTAQSQTLFQIPRIPSQTETRSNYSDIIDNVLLKNVKNAGQFLDGCNVFLSGFNPEENEKLKRILNMGGAIRFDELSETVTHVIVGKKNLGNIRNTRAYILSIEWLAESMLIKRPAPEKNFIVVDNAPATSEPPSPLSKQGAKLLSRNDSKLVQKPSFDLEKENKELAQQEEELLCRYNLSQPGEPLNQPEEPLTRSNSSNSSKLTSSMCNETFFKNLTFFISNEFPEDQKEELEKVIVVRQGQVVGKRFTGVPDYAVVPVTGASLTEMTTKEVVNLYFIKDCILETQIVQIQYYHQPVSFVNTKPLKNCVITVSNYVQTERDFLCALIEELGAVCQAALVRKAKGDALQTTHLVSAEAKGQKYNGAIRWGLPIVHHKWLLDCGAKGVRISEQGYLIGDSKMPTPRNNVTNTTGVETPIAQRSCNAPPENTLPPETPLHNSVKKLRLETPKATDSPDPNRTVTPTSPYGAFYGNDNPSPGTRKRLLKWMNQGADFPQDSPVRPPENRRDSTPLSELLSRQLLMMKRKPEDLPPDSPVANSPKRLNLETDKNQKNVSPKTPVSSKSNTTQEKSEIDSVLSGLQKMKEIEENYAKNCVKTTTPVRKTNDVPPNNKMVIIAESQPLTEIGWEDPTEKEVALVKLEKAASEHRPKKIKYFLVSHGKGDNEDYKKIIEDSGGKVIDGSQYDKRVTHYITANLLRSEKLMACIASGVWILHPSYVQELKSAGDVDAVSEEDHEWGNPNRSLRMNSLQDKEKECAMASHRWRVEIKKGNPRPFNSMKIILHLSSERCDQFRRVIEAGGGEVVRAKFPYKGDFEANLLICDANNQSKIDLDDMAKRRIACVALGFLYDYIVEKPNALEKNFVSGFSEFWDKYS